MVMIPEFIDCNYWVTLKNCFELFCSSVDYSYRLCDTIVTVFVPGLIAE
jgi:hypothetical protein